MEKIPMTSAGLAKLESELKDLKSNQRPAVIQAIAEAREHGDLSENAEYHSAREKQSFIEGRIKELEDIVSRADVIDPSKMSGDQVKFAATVTIVDEDTEEESTYKIVGAHEADIKQNLISIDSPIARALIGRKVGESIEVAAPGGSKWYEIEKVAWI
jgi:transcription elongation factor GreA